MKPLSKRQAWAWAAPLLVGVVAPILMVLKAVRLGLPCGPVKVACWALLGFLGGGMLTLVDWIERRLSAPPEQDDVTRFANAPPQATTEHERL